MISLVFKLPMILSQEKLPGRLLFVGHGASCLGIAGAFGREDYVPWDVIGYWHGRWGRLRRKTKASCVFFYSARLFRDV